MTDAIKKRRRRVVSSNSLGERLKSAAEAARLKASSVSQDDEKAALLAKANEYELAYLISTSLRVIQ